MYRPCSWQMAHEESIKDVLFVPLPGMGAAEHFWYPSAASQLPCFSLHLLVILCLMQLVPGQPFKKGRRHLYIVHLGFKSSHSAVFSKCSWELGKCFQRERSALRASMLLLSYSLLCLHTSPCAGLHGIGKVDFYQGMEKKIPQTTKIFFFL